jgi:hypothetical protein
MKTPEEQIKEWKELSKDKDVPYEERGLYKEKVWYATKVLKLERAKVMKIIDEVGEDVWDKIYKEEVEVDDCLESLNIYIKKLKQKLEEKEE